MYLVETTKTKSVMAWKPAIGDIIFDGGTVTSVKYISQDEFRKAIAPKERKKPSWTKR